MRRLTRILPAAALFAAMALADGPFGVLTSDAPVDTATLVANKVQRLTSLLTLTTAQAAQATSIFTVAQNSIAPLETNLSTYHTSLAAAVKTNTVATIDSLSAQIGTAYGQVTAIRNRADAAFYAILTPAQQTTLSQGPTFTGDGGRGRGS